MSSYIIWTMKSVIIYDSQFGNTKIIAQTIFESLKTKTTARLVQASTATLNDLQGVKIIVIGSPTQGGRPTTGIHSFLDKIPPGFLKGKKVAAFDTRFDKNKVNFLIQLLIQKFDYAAPKISDAMVAKGGQLATPPQGFFVQGKSGPLVLGEEARSQIWANQLI